MFAPEYTLFVHHLRTAIQGSDIQQVELAQRIGKSQAYISKALAGYQALTMTEAWILLSAAEVPFLEWVEELDSALRKEGHHPLNKLAVQDRQSIKTKPAVVKPGNATKPSRVSGRA